MPTQDLDFCCTAGILAANENAASIPVGAVFFSIVFAHFIDPETLARCLKLQRSLELESLFLYHLAFRIQEKPGVARGCNLRRR